MHLFSLLNTIHRKLSKVLYGIRRKIAEGRTLVDHGKKLALSESQRENDPPGIKRNGEEQKRKK